MAQLTHGTAKPDPAVGGDAAKGGAVARGRGGGIDYRVSRWRRWQPCHLLLPGQRQRLWSSLPFRAKGCTTAFGTDFPPLERILFLAKERLPEGAEHVDKVIVIVIDIDQDPIGRTRAVIRRPTSGCLAASVLTARRWRFATRGATSPMSSI